MEKAQKSSLLRGICYILIPILVLMMLISVADEILKSEYGEFKTKKEFAQTEYFSRQYFQTIISDLRYIENLKEENNQLYSKYIQIQDDNLKIYYENTYYDRDISSGISYVIKNKKDGKIYTNIKINNVDEEINNIKSGEIYWCYKDGSIETNIEKLNQENAKYIYSIYESEYNISEYSNYEVYTKFDIEKVSQKSKMILANIVRDITKNMENSEYTISICMILLIAIIIYLIWSIGHKKGKEEIEITSIDKIPYEVLVVGFTIVIVVFAEILFSIFSSLNDIPINLVIGGLVGTYLVIYISLLVIVVSTIRRIKGKIFFRSFLIYRIGKYIKNLLKKIQQNFSDKTGAIKKLTILYVLFIIIFIILQQFCNSYFGVVLMVAFLWIVYYKLLVYTKKTLKIQKTLQEIYDGKSDVNLNPDEFDGVLKEMVKYIDDIAGGFSNAIEQNLKSERLKTELITNVSHDIKTPLTSIINYVDLLKKEQFENKQIEQYVAILDSKSQRLKKLIEDLVEASKASSGNIKLNIEKINLNELINQTVGEFEDKFKVKNLIIETRMPEKLVTLQADSRYMYRIIENLFSNISKYAMNGTRVYIALEKQDEEITIIMKNISNQKLDISVDELKQRFVRGDKSRYTDGSGLGLSIAESLTELQGGKFDISIDGDLFKVTLKWIDKL